MATIVLQGYALDDAGAAIVGGTVHIYARNTTTPALEDAAVTTDANGLWTATQTLLGTSADLYDIEIISGSSKRRRKYDDKIQLDTIELASFRIRNPALTFRYDIVPAAIAADRQLNLPLITATDTLMSLGLAQTVTAAKTFGSALLAVNDVVFPATQVASANANALDDYEEGAWTPVLGTPGTATYTAQVGRYVKWGRWVAISCNFEINLIGNGTPSILAGLPFVSRTLAAGDVQAIDIGSYTLLAINTIFLSGYIGNNSAQITFTSMAASGATITNGPNLFGNGTVVVFQAVYETAG